MKAAATRTAPGDQHRRSPSRRATWPRPGRSSWASCKGAFAKAQGPGRDRGRRARRRKVTSAGSAATGQVTHLARLGEEQDAERRQRRRERARPRPARPPPSRARPRVSATSSKVQGTISSTAGAVQGQSGGGGGVNEAAAGGQREGRLEGLGRDGGQGQRAGRAGRLRRQQPGREDRLGVPGQGQGGRAERSSRRCPARCRPSTRSRRSATSRGQEGRRDRPLRARAGAGSDDDVARRAAGAARRRASRRRSRRPRPGIAQIGKGATKAVQAQHAAADEGAQGQRRAAAASWSSKAYIFSEDAAEVAADLKGGLKQISRQGHRRRAARPPRTPRSAAGRRGQEREVGLRRAGAAPPPSSAASTAGGAAKGASGVAGSVVQPGQEHRDRQPRTTGDNTVTSYTGKVKTAVGKVKDKFSSGLTTTKGEMDAHAAKVQGGTQKIPGENQGKVSQGQAKVNAEATKEPEKPSGLWGKIVSAAKWVAEKLKAAFKFIAQAAHRPGLLGQPDRRHRAHRVRDRDVRLRPRRARRRRRDHRRDQRRRGPDHLQPRRRQEAGTRASARRCWSAARSA